MYFLLSTFNFGFPLVSSLEGGRYGIKLQTSHKLKQRNFKALRVGTVLKMMNIQSSLIIL